MSSLARRLQIRILQRKHIGKVPVLNETTGNVVTRLWPRRPQQLAYASSGAGLFEDTQHPTLQPLIDILAQNARRRIAAA